MGRSSPARSLQVLVLGGTGTISAAAVRAAVAAGHHVTVLNRGRRDRPLPDGTRRLLGDVRDAARLQDVMTTRTFDVVVDFLTYTPEQLDVVLGAVDGSVGHYVFVSSASAYEKPPRDLPITEATPLRNPFWRYSREKIACEGLLVRAHRECGFPVTVVRPSHTYDDASLPTMGRWTDIARMRAGKPVVIHGDGTSLWTITHADDFAVGLTGLLGHPSAVGEAFTITGTHAPTWNQIYGWLAEAAGVAEPRFVHIASETIAAWLPSIGPTLLGDKAHSMVFDTSKISGLVPEFRTTINFDEGARRLLAHHDAHPELRMVDAELDATFHLMVTRVTTPPQGRDPRRGPDPPADEHRHTTRRDYLSTPGQHRPGSAR